MKRCMQLLAVSTLAVTTMGASCFDVTEPLELTFNVEGVTSTYTVPTGTTTFGSPSSCETVSAEQYADADYDITNARVSDITIQTIGTFGGTVSGGNVTINGTPALTFSGSWNAFNEEQSVLDSQLMAANGAGITALIEAVKARQPITICTAGTFSQASTAGLQVKVGVLAQMDMNP